MPQNNIASPSEAKYTNPETLEIANYFHAIGGLMADGKVTGQVAFDSVNSSESSNEKPTMPKILDNLLGQISGSERIIIGEIMDSCGSYSRAHGRSVPADVIHSALYQGLALAGKNAHKIITGVNLDGIAMDSVFAEQSDSLSMQPNRAILAVINAISEAIPIASYLPADIGSNESRLIIANFTAESNAGAYAEGEALTGVNMGEPYINAYRVLRLSSNGGTNLTATVRLGVTKADVELPDAATPVVKLHRSRAIVYVNGIPAGHDRAEQPKATNNIVGSVVIAGDTYTLGGSVNTQTGVITVTSTPDLPANTKVHVKTVINYEDGQEQLLPRFGIEANLFKLYATASRAHVRFGLDSITQFQNEMALDPMSTALVGMRNQYQQERHYDVLRMGERVAAGFNDEFDMAWSSQGLQKNRAAIIADLMAKLSEVSQSIVERTYEFGLKVLYVGKRMVGLFTTLGSEYFVPSNSPMVAGIRFVGTLFGTYAIYYNPRIKEVGNTSRILGVGMSSQVARNPVVFGDAVPMMYLPLSTGSDFKQQQGWYSRSFTEINPFGPSASGFASIDVTNMPT